MRNFLKQFELYLGSVFITVTVVIVVMNVFTRYCLKFTYFWAEEVAVGCFVWTIFLGTAAAYREKGLIGVEALLAFLPGKARRVVELFTSVLMLVFCVVMFIFSVVYVAGSTKITAALEISYAYINSGIILSFALMSLYSLLFVVENIRNLTRKQETSV